MEDLSPPDHNGPPSYGRALRQSREPVLHRLSHSRVREPHIPMSHCGEPRPAWGTQAPGIELRFP